MKIAREYDPRMTARLQVAALMDMAKHPIIVPLRSKRFDAAKRVTGSCPIAWCRSGVLSSIGCVIRLPFLAS